jgi:hypothetical protein
MRLFANTLILTVALLPTAPNKKESQTTEQNAASQNSTNPSSPVTVVVNQPATPEHQNVPHDKPKNGPPIWSNWALVSVAVGTGILALRSPNQIKRQAKATEDAATAAKTSADAVINAERAWVMVDVEQVPGQGIRTVHTDLLTNEQSTMIYARLICKNDGKTPAWITEKRAGLKIIGPHDKLPTEPELDSLGVWQREPEPLGVGRDSKKEITPQAKGTEGFDDSAILYGAIFYRDVFGRERKTVFGYRVTLGNEFKRLIESRYNENT